MTVFAGVVCWKDEAVLAATPRDAASLSDGHFQAIHHPLPLRERDLGRRSGGQAVTEADIVTALRGPLRPDGYLFIPIVGGSGTGKSHLVRWVRDQTEAEQGWETRYLPKNRTGLRRAIEIIIRDLSGPRIAEAREALAAAPAHTENDDILGERLLDELALVISHPEEFLPASAAEVDPQSLQLRDKLSRQLPLVLRDHEVRKRLLAPGGAVMRLVGLALHGRQDGDGLDDDATRFQPSDLPLSFAEIGDVHPKASKLLQDFAGMPFVLNAAVSLINEALPLAEKRITVSGQVDLVEVFREVRRSLHADEKELVLYIEDLTVLHGVEREFLDAIVEPVQSDDGTMCNLRMIFAVTEGHFDDLDTVRKRCDDAYWLDASFGQDGISTSDALSFLGRYLNASRLDPSEVATAWTARTSDRWLPNACQRCDFQVECHDNFGTSPEGYGLYPYNDVAAERLVGALSETRFDPRDVVRQLVNRFLLRGAADLRQGTFPSAGLLEPFDARTEPLNPLFATELAAQRPIDHDRIGNSLRYWGDNADLTQLNSAVLKAFGIEHATTAIDGLRDVANAAGSRPTPGQTKRRGSSSSETTPTREDPAAGLKAPWKAHFAELGAWAGQSKDLSAAATRDLRKLVHKAVLNNVALGAIPVNLGPEFEARFFRVDAHIFVHGSVTQQRQDAAVLTLERTGPVAATLQALILMDQLGESGYPQADRYRRLAAAAIDRWTNTIALELARPPASDAVSAVQAGIVASLVSGRASGYRTEPEDLVAALFNPSPTQHAGTNRSPAWTSLVQQANDLIARVKPTIDVYFGEARGTQGEVRALQLPALMPIVQAFSKSWTLDSQEPSTAAFFRVLETVVAQEWQQLTSHAEVLRDLLDRGREWVDQSERILASLRVAHNAGRLRDASLVEDLAALARAASPRAMRAVGDALDATQTSEATTLSKRIAILATDCPADVATIHRFVTRAATALDELERDLEARRAAGTTSNSEDVAAQVLASTGRFVDAVEALQ